MIFEELNLENVYDINSLIAYNSNLKKELIIKDNKTTKEKIQSNMTLALILNINLLIESLNKEITIEKELINNIKELNNLINNKKEKKIMINDKIKEKIKKEKHDLLNRKVNYEIKYNKKLKFNKKNEKTPRIKNKNRAKKLSEKAKIKFDGCIDTKKSRSAKFD